MFQLFFYVAVTPMLETGVRFKKILANLGRKGFFENLWFFVFCYCLVSFVPMLILHSIALARFFTSVFFHFDRLVVCILKTHRYYFSANDFSAFDLALGLASELCLSPSFHYLSAFRGYYFGSISIFSNKILPNNFGRFSANCLSVLILSAYLPNILFSTIFRCFLCDGSDFGPKFKFCNAQFQPNWELNLINFNIKIDFHFFCF